MTIPSLRSEAQELVAACPQAGELDEVLGIEEQLVHATELVDGQALRAVDQVVQVLEGVLGAVADVMGAQHTTTASIHHQLLEAAQLGHGEAVQHGALGQGEWEALGVEVLDVWGHLDDDHVGDPPASRIRTCSTRSPPRIATGSAPSRTSMPRLWMPSTTYRRRSSSTWCRLGVRISGERLTMVVSQPVAWKNDPYSSAVLPPPMTTQRRGS